MSIHWKKIGKFAGYWTVGGVVFVVLILVPVLVAGKGWDPDAGAEIFLLLSGWLLLGLGPVAIYIGGRFSVAGVRALERHTLFCNGLSLPGHKRLQRRLVLWGLPLVGLLAHLLSFDWLPDDYGYYSHSFWPRPTHDEGWGSAIFIGVLIPLLCIGIGTFMALQWWDVTSLQTQVVADDEKRA